MNRRNLSGFESLHKYLEGNQEITDDKVRETQEKTEEYAKASSISASAASRVQALDAHSQANIERTTQHFKEIAKEDCWEVTFEFEDEKKIAEDISETAEEATKIEDENAQIMTEGAEGHYEKAAMGLAEEFKESSEEYIEQKKTADDTISTTEEGKKEAKESIEGPQLEV